MLESKNSNEPEQEERKNFGFVQYDETNITVVRHLIRVNPVAADIFMFLSQHMNRKNAIACSSKVLEEITQKKRTTVSNAIKYLKAESYLSVMKMGTTNVYVLNPSIVWKAWKTSKPFCEFEGKMFVAKSENEDIERQLKKMNFPIMSDE